MGTPLRNLVSRSSLEMKFRGVSLGHFSRMCARLLMGNHIRLGVMCGAPSIHVGAVGRLPLRLTTMSFVLLAHATSRFCALVSRTRREESCCEGEVVFASRLE